MLRCLLAVHTVTKTSFLFKNYVCFHKFTLRIDSNFFAKNKSIFGNGRKNVGIVNSVQLQRKNLH